MKSCRAEAEAERQRTGEKRRGRQPQPVDERPDAKAQLSFSDAEWHIMRTNNKGWDDWGTFPFFRSTGEKRRMSKLKTQRS